MVELTQADLYSMEALLGKLNEFSRSYGDTVRPSGAARFFVGDDALEVQCEYIVTSSDEDRTCGHWRVVI